MKASPTSELDELRLRLAEAEETLRAIRSGEVDSVMGVGTQAAQVFSLAGTEHAYRMLIESMNEGALTLTAKKIILYANECFARMVKCPLEQVVGSSFRRFLSVADGATLRAHMKQAAESGAKIQMTLRGSEGSELPVQISIAELARDGTKEVIIGMVVTDLTESQRTEERLRSLTQRVVEVQEAERARVALELHDNITQPLCAILVRSQTLMQQISAQSLPVKQEARILSELLGATTSEVERISRHLRPGVLEQLGLAAVLRATSTEFTARTGVVVSLTGTELNARLPADTELALYRILQEALANVQKHAQARHASVHLVQQSDRVQLTIKDDGIGFDPDHQSTQRKAMSGLGLLSIRERAAYVGGTLTVKSTPHVGTEIEVSIPLPHTHPSKLT